jgi:hypothetical protein
VTGNSLLWSNTMAMRSYRNFKRLLKFVLTAMTALGCKGSEPQRSGTNPKEAAAIQFRAVRSGYRGESVPRAGGTTESHPAPMEKEARK